jgi:uncharacterized membrane protein YcaP (DUF421 family)
METVLRVAFIYAFLMAALRVIGKREFGQLAPFDLVVLLLIPELFQQALVRDDFSITNAIIGVSTLLVLVFATSLVSYRSPRVARMIEGVPSVLVQHGRLIEHNLTRERVSPDEVLGAVHRNGLERLAQVKWAILGADGKISVIPWDQEGPPASHEPD